jgi:hypothetical protein
MEYSSEVKIYRLRKPQETSLWKLLDHHFLEFVERYDDLFQQKYGFYRPVISHVVRKYLECGDLREGFARIKCPVCHHEYILAFSCRGRWFCPSCHNKKVVQFGHHLKETVLYPVPHRQYVFSVPKILRRFFFYDRKLLGKLSQCAAKSLTKFFKLILGKKIIKMIMKWRHTSGFNVHNEVRIKPKDDKGIENLSQYIIRNSFSLDKLKYAKGDSSVIYRSKMTHGKNKRNFHVFSPLEFIASITQHIPEPYFQLTRMYGWYSNRMRGDRKNRKRGRKRRG